MTTTMCSMPESPGSGNAEDPVARVSAPTLPRPTAPIPVATSRTNLRRVTFGRVRVFRLPSSLEAIKSPHEWFDHIGPTGDAKPSPLPADDEAAEPRARKRIKVNHSMSLSASGIKQKARELGFDLCGIAPAADLPELAFFAQWLARGYAGEMALSSPLGRTAGRRAPRPPVGPDGHCHRAPSTTPPSRIRPRRADPGRAEIARYAWGDDYHDVIGARLDALLAWMRDTK